MADDAPGAANRERSPSHREKKQSASAVRDDVRFSKYRAAFAESE
jgi:hypothetical protein